MVMAMTMRAMRDMSTIMVTMMLIFGVPECKATNTGEITGVRSMAPQAEYRNHAMALMVNGDAGRQKLRQSARSAVGDGGATHVCFCTRSAFVPGTMAKPGKVKEVYVGNGVSIPVEMVGTIDVWLRARDGGKVRYTRQNSLYTPGLSYNLIPEQSEWRNHGTRIRKEDKMTMRDAPKC